MTIRRLLKASMAVATALFVGSACYTYRPVESPTPGAAVRASLTVEGSVRQSEYLGTATRSLSGKFVSAAANELRLDVITAQSRGTFNDIILRDTLSIPTDQVVVLEEREISWLKTGIIAVAVTTVAAIGFGSVTSGGGDSSSPGPPPTTFEGISFPIFQWGR